MRVKFAVAVFSLFCFLVDPVLAATLRVAKVYRDYPGYINPAVCENPNVSKPPVAPAPQKIVVPLPVVPETAAGTSATPAAPTPTPTSAVETAPAISPTAGSAIAVTPPVVIPLPDPTPAESPRAGKVYRDYPGDSNAQVGNNPTVSKTSAAPAAQIVVLPLPAVPETASGPSAKPETPSPSPVSAVEPAPVTSSSAAAAIAAPTPVVSPLPDPAPASKPDLSVPTSGKIEPLNPASTNIQAGKPGEATYLSLWAGMVAHHDIEIDVDDNRATFDTGIAGGVAVGYDFGPARVEIEGSYRHNNAEQSDDDLKVCTLMANVYADFKTDDTTTPYLGAGVGVANVDLGDEDDQVLAGQVSAGVLFAVTEQVALDLGYRFMVTDAPDIAGNDEELRQHTALLGVQIRF